MLITTDTRSLNYFQIISKFPIVIKSKQSSFERENRDSLPPGSIKTMELPRHSSSLWFRSCCKTHTSAVAFPSGGASTDTTRIVSRSAETSGKTQWANKAKSQLNSQSAPDPACASGRAPCQGHTHNMKSSSNKAQALSRLFHEGFSSSKG